MLIDKNEFFLLTVEDIKHKLKDESPYQILRACGLIRQLIADKPSLLSAINQNLHTKAKFVIPDVKGKPLLDITSRFGDIAWVSVDVDSPIIEKTQVVTAKKFLETYILRYYQQLFTVEQVIKFASNYYGGVHYKEPLPQEKTKKLYLQLENAIDTREKVTLIAIKAICKVTLTAIQPIVDILSTTL